MTKYNISKYLIVDCADIDLTMSGKEERHSQLFCCIMNHSLGSVTFVVYNFNVKP